MFKLLVVVLTFLSVFVMHVHPQPRPYRDPERQDDVLLSLMKSIAEAVDTQLVPALNNLNEEDRERLVQNGFKSFMEYIETLARFKPAKEDLPKHAVEAETKTSKGSDVTENSDITTDSIQKISVVYKNEEIFKFIDYLLNKLDEVILPIVAESDSEKRYKLLSDYKRQVDICLWGQPFWSGPYGPGPRDRPFY